MVLDDVLPPDHEVIEALKRGIRDRLVVELEYLTKGRLEVTHAAGGALPALPRPGRLVPGGLLPARRGTADVQAGADTLGPAHRARHYAPRPEVDLTSGRSGQAFIPGDVATWATVRFEPRWLRHLEDRGVEFATLADGRLEARIPYADEGWMAYEVLRFLGEAVLERPQSARDRIRELAAALGRPLRERRRPASSGGTS